ncbi:DUF4340 domain-containing protein [Leptolyngbya cf. ectocarpi LEGE 11479]|uniref:DUF4340 domain-containing protein n=1 Tax=Leptolyngbya cf. ectocarpi LEGE 11479 TaxID=1828722 RepID=A0A928X0F8_LEPEC|nr:DUF4340 domain-containing protein [Leptolyngbya ectocarpi]MBE9065116.1 DUF4340 domain-containing protein [Leptolyngbya cf. ectocarpi LEGE 11479]
MKLNRSTVGLLGVAIALVAAVSIFETTKNTQPESGDTLYEFTEGDVTTFSIDREETPLAFAKADDTWQMTEPQDVPADPSSIAFLLNIITSDTITETITATADQLDNYGLGDPNAVVSMTVGEEEYTLAVGGEDFSGTSLYTMTVDESTDTESVDVYLMPNSLSTGLERPLEEWILQPEEEESAEEEPQAAPAPEEESAEEELQSTPDSEEEPSDSEEEAPDNSEADEQTEESSEDVSE